MADADSDLSERTFLRTKERLRRQKFRPWWVLIVVAIVLALGLAGAFWLTDQAKPLTARQNVVLTALVHEASTKTGRSTQAIWADVNRRFGVRAHEELQKSDYSRAESFLLNLLGVDQDP